MRRFRVLPATLFDGETLLRNMRQQDIEEMHYCRYALGHDRSRNEIVGKAFETHPVWAMLDGADLVALMGIDRFPETDIGVVWVLGTDLFDSRWRAATRTCKAILPVFARDYRAVMNVVPAHMERKVAWLQHLGFDMAELQAKHRGKMLFFSASFVGPETA